MKSLRDLIRSVQTRAQPTTWGALAEWLTTELARIKQEGQIMVNPPEVILPDGVTTTSLISQSEMTQFVTNTLNVWLSSINSAEPVSEEDVIKKILFPELYWYNDSYGDGTGRYGTKGEKTGIRYLSNYKKCMDYYFNKNEWGSTIDPPYSYFYTKSTAFYPNGAVRPASLALGGAVTVPISVALQASYGGMSRETTNVTYLSARFISEPIDETNYSNLKYQVEHSTPYKVNSEFGVTLSDSPNEVGRSLYYTPNYSEATGKTRILISAESPSTFEIEPATNNFEVIPLFEIYKEEPWYPQTVSYPRFKFVAVFPRVPSGLNE